MTAVPPLPSQTDPQGETPLPAAVPAYRGPRGFHWMVPGLLATAAQPGLIASIESDLEALCRVGTRLLVTLTEEWTPDPALVGAYGIESLYLPIPDKHPPDAGAARTVCDVAAQYIERGEAVVYHCRAGKGRSGTFVAAQLIHAGIPPDEAVSRVRAEYRFWIETDAQLEMILASGRVLAANGVATGKLSTALRAIRPG